MEKKVINPDEEKTSVKTNKTEENSSMELAKTSNVFTEEVKLISKPVFVLQGIGNALLKGILWVLDLILSMFLSLGRFFYTIYKGVYKGAILIYRFFKRKVHQFKYNDWSGKLSYLVFGASSFKHGQIVNGCLYLLFEIAYIVFFIVNGIGAIGMLSSLGITPSGTDPNCTDMFCEYVQGDNSVMVLVYGLLWVFSIFLFLYIWNRSINSGYDNYRIQNFVKYHDIYGKNVQFSNELDLLAKEALENKVHKSEFVDQNKDKINTYLTSFKGNKFNYDFSKYLINETVVCAYEEYREIAKEEKKLAKLEAKYNKYLATREAKRNAIDKNSESKVFDKFDIKTNEKAHSLLLSCRKEKNKITEMNKTHASFATKEDVKNDNKYEKFNVYYKYLGTIDQKLTFYKNYDVICKVYDYSLDKFSVQNTENANKKVLMEKDTNAKLVEINKKYDAIILKRKDLLAKIKTLQVEQESKIKDIKNSNSGSKNQEILDLKAHYFTQISSLSGEYNDLPTEKVIKAMRKEELKEVTHAYNRDRKYLKTNFTSLSFAKEAAVNKMLVDLKLDYKFANEIVDQVVIINKQTKKVEHLSKDEVNARIDKLSKDQAEYIAKHSDKFVGKSKSFKEQMNSLFNENFHVTILTIPILGVIFFVIMPLFFSILVAFTNYSYGHIPPTQLFTWAGWLNFDTLFNADPNSMYALLPSALLKTLGWTITWTIFATFSNYFLGIILALLVNKEGIRFKKFWRTVFIMTIAIPQFISLMSIGVLLKDTGAIGYWWANTFGSRLGFGNDSTNGALVSKIIIILVNIWVGIPYTMLSTTGILMNIPKDLYESARVDGASTFTQFNKITLPYILFVTGPYLITQFIGNVNNFNIIYFLTGGGPNLSGTSLQIGHTDLLITFLYKMITSGNNPQYGIASAVGIVIFVICAFFSIIMYNKSGAVQSEDQFQ
jgi:arabinogalactan oligomer/maltooligosaccharide transport system permease protein